MNNFYFTHNIMRANPLTQAVLFSSRKEKVQYKEVKHKEVQPQKTLHKETKHKEMKHKEVQYKEVKQKEVESQEDCSVLSEDEYPSNEIHQLTSGDTALLLILLVIVYLFLANNPLNKG